MAIELACPNCAAALTLPDRLDGKLIRCKTCLTEIRVGGESAADPDEVVDSPPVPPVRRKSVISPLGLNVAGIVAVLLLLALGGAIFALVKVGARALDLPAMDTQLVELSNPRRFGARYAVDYAYVNRPTGGQGLMLIVRTPSGTRTVWLQSPSGGRSTIRVPAPRDRQAAARGPVDMWLTGPSGERVSNVATLD